MGSLGGRRDALSGRITSIDACKGILITSVVIGHTPSPLVSWIYLFHIPAFFFLSGCTARFADRSAWETLRRRARALLIPFCIANLTFVALRLVLNVAGLESYFFPTSINGRSAWVRAAHIVTRGASVDPGGATWFLVVLFQASMLGWMLLRPFRHDRRREALALIPSLALLLLGHWLCATNHILFYDFDLALAAQFYLVAGYLARDWLVESGDGLTVALAIPAGAALYWFHVRYHPLMNWPTRSFDTVWADISSSLAGMVFLWAVTRILCRLAETRAAAVALGRRSLAILVFHFLAFRVVYVLFYAAGVVDVAQLREPVLVQAQTQWVTVTVAALAICTAIDLVLARRPLPARLFLGRAVANRQGASWRSGP